MRFEISQRVSVRFVAATNRDPELMIQERTLREDLYYRLRGIEIRLPVLSDRTEDIPLLARHFLGEDGGEFTPDALDALVSADWPGNVRQLRNIVQGAKAAAGATTGAAISHARAHLDSLVGAALARTTAHRGRDEKM